MGAFRKGVFPRPQLKPPKKVIPIRPLLDRTILLPMNATLAGIQQLLIPKKGTTPLQESWKVIKGTKRAPTGRRIAEKLGLPAPAVSGFATEVLADPLTWLPIGILSKGLRRGTIKGTKVLSTILSKSRSGKGVISGAKALRKGFKNVFNMYGHVPTRAEVGLTVRAGARELRPLIEGRHFMIKGMESKILDRMTRMANKYKNFSAVDLEMVPTLIEKNFNLTDVIKLHGRAPSSELVNLAKQTAQMLSSWHKVTKKVGIKERDLKAIGYFPHMMTAEARSVLEKLYPKVLRGGGVSKLYLPKHRWMMRRSTGYLDVPAQWMKQQHPRAQKIYKFLTADGTTLRVPLTQKRAVTVISKEMRKLGQKPNFQFWTIREINQLAQQGKLPILKGQKVDKFLVDNPYMGATWRLFGSARAITNRQFIDDVARHDSAGGFSRLASEVGKDPAWVRSPLIANNVTGGEALRFPKEVAEAIERGYKATSLTDETRQVMGLFDTVQGYWKKWTLLPIPGYHLRNMFGNLWNNWLAGVNTPVRYVQASRIMNGKTGQLGKYSYGQIRKMIVKNSIRGRGFYAKEASQQRFLAMLTERLKPSTTAKINPLYYGRMVGEGIEDNARVALFIDQLAKGKSPEIASKTVRKFLFNYDELSTIERKIFKRVVPFYTWSRFNMPLQIEQMIANPGRWSIWAKGARAIEPTMKPDTRYMPPWMKEAVPMLWKRDPKSGQFQYFVLHNWIPSADLQDLFKGDTLIEMMSPLIKAPLEFFTNYSSFAERSIERYPSEVQNYLGINMPRKVANLVRNVRLLNELDRANPGFIFGTKTRPGIFGFTRSQELELPMKMRIINVLSGLKLYPYHFQQAKRHHDRVQAESIMALRGFQRTATRQGNMSEAIRIQRLIEKEMEK